ncbi:MAG TPA: hypothetical protein VK762_37575 [Polyangiaceae bacterium]|nr:hypothetical protein [Polyangiaceae bacterium]
MKPKRYVPSPFLVCTVAALSAACGSSSSTTPDAGEPVEAGVDAESATDSAAETDTGTTEAGAPVSEAGPSDAGTGFTPSNVPLTSFPSAAGDVTISASTCTVDTDKLTVDCVSPGADGGLPYVFVTGMQSDGSSVAVLAVNSLSISTAASLTLRGAVPLIVWARTTVNLQGPFIGDPAFHPTNGGGAIETQSGTGGGPGGGGVGLSNPQLGGGGGGYCGTGGAGANSQTVASDGGAPVAGGRSYGNPTITPLVGGSSGGGAPSGQGGEGGGAVEITAGTSILIGSGGAVSVPGYGGSGNGGGGGSGGSILLEAPSVTVNGVLAANGGGGAVFSGGGSAQDGQPSAQPAMGQDANSAVGSAGTQINGADGKATPTATSSGGGGGGRIRINTATGMATIGPSATVSPALTTSCATQGTLP